MNDDPQPTAEELLEATLAATLRDLDLATICTDTGLPILTDEDGTPVEISDVHTFDQAGVLTIDRGVYLELSDGSAYALTLGVSRRPNGHSHSHSHRARLRDAHRHQ